MDKWRFIDSGRQAPFFNMALDNFLFNSFSSHNSISTFRIYRWNKPAISLGRFQEAEEILNIKNCRKDNISIVKRITGGGAIYHSPDELTYSLVCAASFFKADSVKDSYRKITRFLIKAYRALGFSAQYARDYKKSKKPLGAVSDFCFSGWQDYDILIAGKKIGGNAQKRKKGVIFQHGSIPFKIPANIDNYFLKPINNKNNYLCLSEINFTDVKKLKKTLVESFKNNLNNTLSHAPVNF